jgi:hypothetical protein
VIGFITATGACAMGKTPKVLPSKTVTWQEEVRLGTGEVIMVERETRFRPSGGEPFRGSGWAADVMTMRFRYPPDAKEVIEWRTVRYGNRFYQSPDMQFAREIGPGKTGPHIKGYSPEYPLVLDLDQETKSLYVITLTGGCNEYFRYRYENGVWRDDMLLEVFETRPANLLLGSEAPNVLLGLEARNSLPSSEARKLLHNSDEINISSRITLDHKRGMDYERLGYNIGFRQVGPDRCLCSHIGNPDKRACLQKYQSTKE